MKKENIIFVEKPSHKQFVDIEGRIFNRWTVLGYAGKIGDNQMWWCECSCPEENIKKITSNGLRSHLNKSCGCLRDEKSRERWLKHGKAKSPEFKAYSNAKDRCTNIKNKCFHIYGARGIEFRFNTFEEFYAELGTRPSKNHSVDRINVNRHYEKGNLRWATDIEQARNTRQNRWLQYNNQTKCLSEWAIEYNINVGTLCHRLILNWCMDCALNIPVRKGVCKHK